jgi:L-lactate dehydrogenase complex protein LldE
MRIGLFIPCYIDQLYPSVGIATLSILERLNLDVDFPAEQTCCGQPMANTGCSSMAKPFAEKFVRIFEPYDFIVCPSGSCTAMVRHHYPGLVDNHEACLKVTSKTYELCEFLVDVLKVERIPSRFPHRVGYHQSCHGLRELRLAKSSELVEASYSKVRRLLEGVEGLELVDLQRVDECCGFGGTFSVNEESVSCLMGLDRINDHKIAGAEFITAVDMSCLMHMEGLIKRLNKPIQVIHIAELLAGERG